MRIFSNEKKSHELVIGVLGNIYSAANRTVEILKFAEEQGFETIYIDEQEKRVERLADKIILRLKRGFRLIPIFFKSNIIFIPSSGHNLLKIVSCRLLHKYMICDYYISLYDTSINDRKTAGKKSLKGIVYYVRDKVALKYSDIVLFLNKSEAIHYSNIAGVLLENINYRIVPIYRPDNPKSDLPYFHNRKEELMLCWTGTFIPLHGLDKILDMVEILKNERFHFKLCLFGPEGSDKEKWRKIVNHRGLDEYVQFKQIWGNISEWQRFIKKNCDITLGIFGDSLKAQTVLANKVMDGISAKTVVITAHSKGVQEYFDGSEIFIVENSAQAIAEEIKAISNLSIVDINHRVDKAYDIYQKHFCYNEYKSRIIKLFEELREQND